VIPAESLQRPAVVTDDAGIAGDGQSQASPAYLSAQPLSRTNSSAQR
jgi:hypothetical protein